jgi:uncharacterized protein (TIGR03435 family)
MRATLVVIAFIGSSAVIGQQPTFDVASVRLNLGAGAEGSTGMSMSTTPSGIAFMEVSLANVLEAAYDVTPSQIKGPGWIRSDRYDIVARTTGPASRDELMAMTRTLLTDRFRLVLHHEQQQLPVFALVPAKKGPNLTPSKPGLEARRSGTKRGMSFQSWTMSDLARYLSRQGPIGRPVTDQTGLQGRFDFTLALDGGFGKIMKKVEGGKESLGDNELTLFTDTLEAVGLRLEGRRMPVDVLVVDRAEKIPTEN